MTVGRLGRVAEGDGARHAVDADGPPFELELYPFADERDLILRVARIGEAELEQVLVDERARRPGEHLHAVETPTRVGDDDVATLASRWRPEADAGERSGVDAQGRPRLPGAFVCVEQPVGPIEPEQVLTLDVEHEDAEVGGARSHDLRGRGQ